MRLYLAGGAQGFKICYEQGASFSGINILQSFVYCNAFTEEVIIPTAQSFMLDSGAFTFRKKAVTVDWDAYVEKYAAFINRNRVDLFFELDIDSIVGLSEVERLRVKLEGLVGKPSIPVWHKSRGKQYFLDMCDSYEYVAIGGMAKVTGQRDTRSYLPWFTSMAHKRGARIHGLGFTPRSGLPEFGFDSVDSSTWTAGVRYGTVHMFSGNGMSVLKKPKGKRSAYHKHITLHNFNEWKKYSDFLKRF